ncbi:MAG: HDOD domain-containing protein [Burkholderiales bacterium]
MTLDTSLMLQAVSAADGDRLAMLFRDSLRNGQVHPLWHVMQRYRAGCASQVPAPAQAPLPQPPAGTAPVLARLALAPEAVRRTVAGLPPLPQAALRALKTLQREESSLDELASDLGCDASLTARVLRLANAPFYGVAGRVASVRDAVLLLGRRTLASVLTVSLMTGQFETSRSRLFDVRAFWRHALATAIISGGLARAARLDEDQAFVAGLLHDIGLLAMSVYFPVELDGLLQTACNEDTMLRDVEQRYQLTSHADVGAWIAEHWRFPAPVVEAVASHHGAPAQPVGIAACVHVAVAVAHALDVPGLAHESVPPIDAALWLRVSSDEDACLALFEQAETGVRTLCAALSL